MIAAGRVRVVRLRALVAALALLATIAGTATAPPASADSHVPAVVSQQWVGERLLDLVVHSPAMGADVPVRLLVPDGWRDRAAGKRWPVLYLLHGRTNGYTSWTDRTDVEELDALRDTLVVMPEGGPVGWYSNWWNGGLGGPPAWETFHLAELRRLLEESYAAGGARAVAGLSMGGLGALGYAARYPGEFRAAASYSGVVDTQMPGAPELILALTSLPGVNPLALWGHPVAQAAVWSAHNPAALAGQLRGTPVFLSSGNGTPGPLDAPGSAFDPLEAGLFAQNLSFAQRLVSLGIPVTTDFYGAGRHDWPYWERELQRSLPLLLGSLDNGATVAAPAGAGQRLPGAGTHQRRRRRGAAGPAGLRRPAGGAGQ
jgi:diacylglycerol O-acyltransferase/trehalose O-mycolyltransferase